MKNLLLLLLISISITIHYSCNPTTLSKNELIHWVETPSNGLIQSVENNFFQLDLLYEPLDYKIARENKQNNIDIPIYEKNMSELEGLQYFKLKIASKTGEEIMSTALQNEQEYYARMNYFLSEFQRHLHLVEAKDTLDCILYHFERNYGTASFNNVLMGFEATTAQTDKKLIISQESPLFSGLSFVFPYKNLQRIPQLKLSNK